MAVRRPPAPHLRPGRPGAPERAPLPPAPAITPDPAPAVVPAAVPASAVAPVEAAPAPGPAPATTARPRTARRAVLLAGAAAAVTGAVGAGLVLTRDQAVPSSASSAGPGSGSVGAAVGDAAPFPDVAADHPAAAAIRWAHESGVQPALSARSYAPDQALDRGAVAVALHRLAGAPAVDTAALPHPFTDLGEDPARVTALLWLHGRGALWGDAEMRVRPEDPATRDCTAMLLAALLRPALAGRGVTWDPATDTALPQPVEPGSALPDLAWLVAAGMMPEEVLPEDADGDATVTRADIALSLHRVDEVLTAALS